MCPLQRDSLKSYLQHSIKFVLNRVNEQFHESENETGCCDDPYDFKERQEQYKLNSALMSAM